MPSVPKISGAVSDCVSIHVLPYRAEKQPKPGASAGAASAFKRQAERRTLRCSILKKPPAELTAGF
jgi:hypothetical protein